MSKKSKKFVAASVAATLVVPAVATAELNPNSTEKTFTDLQENAYYYDAVLSLANRNILHGYGNGLFGPEDSITRGQAAKLIAGILNLDVTNIENPAFSDVPTSHMFYTYIAALKSKGIITGYADDNTFRPEQEISRDEMAIILTRAFKLEVNDAAIPFTDTSAYMKPFVAAIYNAGITEGVDETTFAGSMEVSRAQAATFIFRAENQQAAKGSSIKASISKIVDNQVEIDGELYDVGTYGQVLHEGNADALENAILHATVKNGVIVNIESIKIVAKGTNEAPIKLTKFVATTASLTNVIKNEALDFNLIVDSPFVKIMNLSFAQIDLTETVEQLHLDGSAEKLSIAKNVKAILSGKASIGQLIISSKEEISLNIDGEIESLSFEVAQALVKLAKTIKVTELKLAEGTKAEQVISNFKEVKEHISTVNGEKPAVQETTPIITPGVTQPTPTPTPTPSPGVETNPAPAVPPTSSSAEGTVSSATETAVTIEGKTYQVSASLGAFFKGSDLTNAIIAVKLENNTVVEITSLTVNAPATIDSNGTVINGNVTIASENVTLKGLTIKGDLIVKGNIQGDVTVDNTTISGTVRTEQAPPIAKARSLVAAMDFMPVLAAENVTRLKITFNNSSVAILEVKTSDSIINFKGATVISLVDIQSNGSLIADPEVVLPAVVISKGVTAIELNVSIAKVEIESTTAVELTGNGNFDKVEVKTDQLVTLNTKGTINTLATTSNAGDSAKIELGQDLKVGKTEDLTTGERVEPEKVISNIADEKIKQNINEEFIKQDFIAAKILPVPNKFGFATFNVLNQGDNKVYYQFVEAHKGISLLEKGAQLPNNLIEYNPGDEFIPWFDKDIQVYTVDEDNTIVGAFAVNAYNNMFFRLSQIEKKQNEIVLKSIYSDSSNVGEIYLAQGDQFKNLLGTTLYKLTKDENGIPTVTIPLPADAKVNPELYTMIFYSLQKNNGRFSSSHRNGNNEYYDQTLLTSIYEFAKMYTGNSNMQTSRWFEYGLDEITGYSLVEPYLFDVYAETFKTTKYATAEEVKNKVIAINEENKNLVAMIKDAEAAVTELYKENPYQYDYYDQLKETASQETIQIASDKVSLLPEGKAKSELSSEIQKARDILSYQEGILRLPDVADQFYSLTTKSDVDYSNFYNELSRYVNSVNGVTPLYSQLFLKYAGELKSGNLKTKEQINEAITTINNINAPLIAPEKEAINVVDRLFLYNGNYYDRSKLAEGVTQEMIDAANVKISALSDLAKFEKNRLEYYAERASKILFIKNNSDSINEQIAQYKASTSSEEKLRMSNELTEILRTNINGAFHQILLDKYLAEFEKNNITLDNLNEVTKIVQTVNNSNLEVINRYNRINQKINNLYLENSDLALVEKLSVTSIEDLTLLKKEIAELPETIYNKSKLDQVVTNAIELATIVNDAHNLEALIQSYEINSEDISKLVNVLGQYGSVEDDKGRYVSIFKREYLPEYVNALKESGNYSNTVEHISSVIKQVNDAKEVQASGEPLAFENLQQVNVNSVATSTARNYVVTYGDVVPSASTVTM